MGGVAKPNDTSFSISIHALREEGDAGFAHIGDGGCISIHALREEGDVLPQDDLIGIHDFYPRPPRGGRLISNANKKLLLNFYPRPPRGGRQPSTPQSASSDGFLSTPSARRATWPHFPLICGQ